MPAIQHIQHDGTIGYEWKTREAAEAALAALPDGDYSIPDLIAVSRETAAAGLTVIAEIDKLKAKPKRQVRFQGDSGNTILEHTPKTQPGLRKHSPDWIFHIQDGVLTVERC